jgi:hypothetical protein
MCRCLDASAHRRRGWSDGAVGLSAGESTTGLLPRGHALAAVTALAPPHDPSASRRGGVDHAEVPASAVAAFEPAPIAGAVRNVHLAVHGLSSCRAESLTGIWPCHLGGSWICCICPTGPPMPVGYGLVAGSPPARHGPLVCASAGLRHDPHVLADLRAVVEGAPVPGVGGVLGAVFHAVADDPVHALAVRRTDPAQAVDAPAVAEDGHACPWRASPNRPVTPVRKSSLTPIRRHARARFACPARAGGDHLHGARGLAESARPRYDGRQPRYADALTHRRIAGAGREP